MCGIAGIFQRTDRHAPEQLERWAAAMAGTLIHRGPDDGGVWLSDDGRCALAHRRLSVIEPTESGHQPMSSTDGRAVISFNGEIYNYLELRPELERLGCRFAGRTDTEVLLEALRTWGLRALVKLDGMFVFACYDLDERRLVLGRDAFGEKPLYIYDDGECVAFASELQALQVLPFFDDSIDEDRLAEYLCFTYIDAPRTIFSGVSKLPPGTSMEIGPDGRSVVRRYFEFSPGVERSDEERDEDELVDELEEILVRLVRRRLISDVPLGAFLSGGVDSSTVCALVRRRLDVPLRTFSIGWVDSEESEHEQAQLFADHLGTDHFWRHIAPDAMDFLLHAGERLDEPNGDSSCLPTLLLSEYAREQVTVCVSGDGGDEMFGGYGRYLDTMRRMRRRMRKGRPADAGQEYYSHMMFFSESDIRALFGRIPSGLLTHLDGLRHYVRTDGGRADLLMRMRKTDTDHYLPGAVLAKVDRMSMQHSLEVRTPFLSIELARFVERLPSRVLCSRDGGKLLLKRVAERYLPRKWLDLKKRGFGLPSAGGWGSREILDVVGPLLDSAEGRLASVLGRDAMRRFVDRQRQQPRIYQLWAIGILESWLRARPTTLPTHTDAAPIELRETRRLDVQEPRVRQAVQGGFGDVALFCRGGVPDWWARIPGRVTIVASFALAARADLRSVQAPWADPDGSGLNPLEGRIARGALAVFGSPEDAPLLTPTFCERLAALGFAAVAFGTPDESGCVYDLDAYIRASRHAKRSLLAPGRRLARWPVSLKHVGGWAYRPRGRAGGDRSSVAILEGRRPLLLAGSLPEDVRDRGWGRFRGDARRLLFSSSDGTNPKRRRHSYRALDLTHAGLAPWWSSRDTEEELDRHTRALSEAIEADDGSGIRVPRRGDTIALVVESLYAGGAERQWIYLGRGLVDRGYRVVLIGMDLGPGRAHCLELARDSALEVRDLRRQPSLLDPGLPSNAISAREAMLAADAPVEFRRDLWRMIRDLCSIRADFVACQLDTPNVVGGIAGLLAGVRRVLLSFRNMNPTNLPSLDRPWLRPYYRALARSPRVVLSGNSHACNTDYARWLGMPDERIVTIRNAFETWAFDVGVSGPGSLPALGAEPRKLRERLGLPPNAVVVGGAFRIADEKDPATFVEVARALIAERQDVFILHAGDGPELAMWQRQTRNLGLEGRLRWLGRVENVLEVLEACDVVLMTSRHEGLPNVLLEAQHVGRPVVATDAGGTAEAVDPGVSGLLLPTGDVAGLARTCLELLADPELRQTMGAAGQRYVRERFRADILVDETLRVLGGQ